MDQPGILSEGFRRVWHYKRALLWIFIINLFLALFGSMPALTKLEDLGHSAQSRRLTDMFDYGTFSELLSNPELDPMAGHGASLHFAVLFFFFMLFVTGGVLEAYRAERKLKAREFFEMCGTCFWRWIWLAILMLIVMIPVFILVPIISKAFRDLAMNSPNEMAAYEALFDGVLLTLFLLMCVRLWFDMAQVRIVAEGDLKPGFFAALSSAWRNAGRAFKLTFGNFGSLFWLFFRISFMWWALLALTFWIWTMMPPARFWWTFVIFEVFVLIGFGLRLWQRASEMVWYQRRFPATAPAVIPVTPAPDPLLVVAPLIPPSQA